MKKTLVEAFVELAIFWAILIIIHFAWQGLEILFDGGIQPSVSDSIMGTILVWSIRRNLRLKIVYGNGGIER